MSSHFIPVVPSRQKLFVPPLFPFPGCAVRKLMHFRHHPIVPTPHQVVSSDFCRNTLEQQRSFPHSTWKPTSSIFLSLHRQSSFEGKKAIMTVSTENTSVGGSDSQSTTSSSVKRMDVEQQGGQQQDSYYASYLEATTHNDDLPARPPRPEDDLPTNIHEESQLASLPEECLSGNHERPLRHVDDLGNSYMYSLSPMTYSVINILMVEMFERFAFYSICYTMTLFLTGAYNDDWNAGFTSVKAASFVSVSTMVAYSTPFVGAFLADSLLGDYKSVLLGLLVFYIPGVLIIMLTTVPHLLGEEFNDKLLTLAVLCMWPMGTGIVKSIVNGEYNASICPGNTTEAVVESRIPKLLAHFIPSFRSIWRKTISSSPAIVLDSVLLRLFLHCYKCWSPGWNRSDSDCGTVQHHSRLHGTHGFVDHWWNQFGPRNIKICSNAAKGATRSALLRFQE